MDEFSIQNCIPADRVSCAPSRLPVALVLVLGLALSVAAAVFTHRHLDQIETREIFERHAAPQIRLFNSAIERDLEVVHSIGALFVASSDVDRREFATFVKRSLAHYPAIKALEWIPRVPAADREAYEQRAHRDGLTEFRITERNGDGDMVAVAPRAFYYPVFYVEPLAGNERALGFDLASNPARRNALNLARDTGEAVGSQRITLVQETGTSSGVLIFVPVYTAGIAPDSVEERRRTLTGFALGVFRIDEIVSATLSASKTLSDFSLYLFDESAGIDERLLYARNAANTETPAHKEVVAQIASGAMYGATIDVAGRRWLIAMKPADHGSFTRIDMVAWAIAAIGVLLTALLTQHLISSRGRTQQVEDLVVERTVELSATNHALEAEMAERRRIEEYLSQAQKMEAIGQLTGGIAHDFNNLLMVIEGYAQRAVDKIADRTAATEALRSVLTAADKAAKLTRQLLVFSRRQIMEKRVFEVAEVLTEVEKLLPRSLGERYQLSFVPNDGGACVETDPAELGQAIMNLAINARDAMPDGGPIVIGTQVVTVSQQFSHRHPGTAPGRFVEIYVSDKGEGIDADVLPRIFEPFFTTKEVGKGTGLGLSMVYGFAQQSQGAVDISSNRWEGTTVQIFLPVADRKPQTTSPDIGDLPRGRGETILLVEDDESLLELTRSILCDLGYRVLTAANGVDAIEVDEENDGKIDLLLTDVVMPILGGFELVEAMRVTRPAIKVVFMSGYAKDKQGEKPQVPGRFQFLQKPIKAPHLAKTLRDELDRAIAPVNL